MVYKSRRVPNPMRCGIARFLRLTQKELCMATEITRLGSPIDAMYLIHKALRAEAVRAEEIVDQLRNGESLQRFKLAFNAWVTALIFHAEQEENHLTDTLGAPPSPGTNGAAGLEALRAALLPHEEESHQELVESVQGVFDVLNEEIGKTSIIARTKQHLYGQVMALRIAQEDHLDIEESLVMPVLRERMDERTQLEAVRALLLDDGADDPRWMIDWMGQDLSPDERRLLEDLEARFTAS